jgi:hypothetical protein
MVKLDVQGVLEYEPAKDCEADPQADFLNYLFIIKVAAPW